MRTVRVLDRLATLSAQSLGDCGRERATVNSDRLSSVVEIRLLLGRGIPGVGLDGRVIALRLEGATGDGDLAKALVAGTVDDRDCRAVLNSAVAFELLNRGRPTP